MTTPMTKEKKGPWMISPTDCVISSLGDLGKTDATFTGFKHKMSNSIFSLANERKRFSLYRKGWKKTDIL